jgi:acetone carboxylase gamma subunit
MYITKCGKTYILWSDKRKIICVNQDRERIYSYMNVLLEKKQLAEEFSNSWLYMCLKHNIYFV